MQMNGLIGGFYRISEWIMKLAYLNLLWVCFSALGLLIFGFFPATTAMFAVVRKWHMKEYDIPVFKTFWSTYKKELLKSNLLGLILSLSGYILYIDYIFLLSTTNGHLRPLVIPLFIIILAFVLILLYVFPVYVHFDLKLVQVFKNAFIIMIMNPFATIIMIVGSMAVYFFMTFLPGFFPLFSGSAFVFVVTWAAFIAFSKVESRKPRGMVATASQE